MKKHRGKPIVQITHPEIEHYAEQHTDPESDQVQQLISSSDQELEYIDMLSGKVVGQLLKMLVKLSGARRILEVGTFTGYSAVMMAEALPAEGELVTIEMNLRYQQLAEKHFRESTVQHKIRMIKGNAQEVIPELQGYFDLAYLDGDKLGYPFYFEEIISKLRPGGVLVVDNVLWDGTVLDPQDHKAKAIQKFNRQVYEDDRVEKVLLPVRDGVYLIRKK